MWFWWRGNGAPSRFKYSYEYTFGGATQEALEEFQANYLGDDEVNGMTGPKTWNKLNEEI